MSHKLTVGQKLWFVPSSRRDGEARHVTVARVGRQWATLEGRRGKDRIDLKTLWLDGRGYTPAGRCYLTREEWEQKDAVPKAWHELREIMDRNWAPPDGLTAEEIRRAIAIIVAPSLSPSAPAPSPTGGAR